MFQFIKCSTMKIDFEFGLDNNYGKFLVFKWSKCTSQKSVSSNFNLHSDVDSQMKMVLIQVFFLQIQYDIIKNLKTLIETFPSEFLNSFFFFFDCPSTSNIRSLEICLWIQIENINAFVWSISKSYTFISSYAIDTIKISNLISNMCCMY